MGNTHVLSDVTSKSIFKEFEETNTRQNQQISEGCARNNLANLKEFQSPVNIPRMQLHIHDPVQEMFQYYRNEQ